MSIDVHSPNLLFSSVIQAAANFVSGIFYFLLLHFVFDISHAENVTFYRAEWDNWIPKTCRKIQSVDGKSARAAVCERCISLNCIYCIRNNDNNDIL